MASPNEASLSVEYFADDSVDSAYMHNAMSHAPQQPALLEEDPDIEKSMLSSSPSAFSSSPERSLSLLPRPAFTPPSEKTSLSMSPTPHKSRQAAWWQSSVVRRSSSQIDEMVDELTEKSRFLLRNNSKSPRSPFHQTTGCSPKARVGLSTSNGEGNADTRSDLSDWNRLNSPSEDEDEDKLDVEEELSSIALFRRDEILVGELLGEGTFSCVYEVAGFEIKAEADDKYVCQECEEVENQPLQSLEVDLKWTPHGEKEAQLRQAVLAAPVGSFALKHLKQNLLNSNKEFQEAATDLVMEAKYLSALDHPGILKLRGAPNNGSAAFANTTYGDGFFLLTDRLVETLQQRIKRWKLEKASDPTNNLVCKTRYALEIADALRYLHEQRIIFRDLKPSNVGFLPESDRIQLFDFGLCRELPPISRSRPYKHTPVSRTPESHSRSDAGIATDNDEYSVTLEDEEMDESWTDEYEQSDWDISNTPHKLPLTQQLQQHPCREDVYFMSGAGTQIYMAPEILLSSRYNLKADVYSWAMTVTEMLLVEHPLPSHDLPDHIQYVCREGDRPYLEDHPEIPESLKELLSWAWTGDVSERCSMAQVCDELQGILEEIKRPTPKGQYNQKYQIFGEYFQGVTKRFSCGVKKLYRRWKLWLASAMDRLLSLFRANETFTIEEASIAESSFTATPAPNGAPEMVPSERGGTQSRQSDIPPQGSSIHQASNDGHSMLLPQDSTKDHNNNHYAKASTWCLSAPEINNQSQFRTVNSHVLKRKPSSASTTATTDDEDDYDLPSGSSSLSGRALFLKTVGSMEAVMERR